MLNYDIEFYTDNKFESKYESKLITKVGTFGDGVVGLELIFQLEVLYLKDFITRLLERILTIQTHLKIQLILMFQIILRLKY